LSLAILLLAIPHGEAARVDLGIDVLEKHDFSLLRGKRVGLITNQTGINQHGTRTRQILHKSRQVRLVALFTPEHGLDGTEKAGKYVTTRKDRLTGLTAYSLYGPNRKPTPAMLKGIDTLVFDMQDIGCRSYTYISTMARCMEAAGELGIEFVVLDRPNPLGGERIEGPGLEKRWTSFVGQVPVPYVHGMTVGELARMINGRRWMATRCNLKVVRMEGWKRNMAWNRTGLRWKQTSPNIPHGDSPLYYAATGIAGSLSGLTLGIGTSEPFELIAAPWLDASRFTKRMKSQNPGIKFTPLRDYGRHKVNGTRLKISPTTRGNLIAVNVFAIAEVNKRTSRSLFARSSKDTMDIFTKVYGSTSLRRGLESGKKPAKIVKSWAGGVSQFRKARKKYLLYK